METLTELVCRAQESDLDAYGDLVRRFQARAIGYARTRLGDSHLAEDVAQEAFIQVYLHLGELRNPAAFPGWLRKIVFKYCDRLTRRKGFFSHPLDAVPEPVSPALQSDELAAQRDVQRRVRQAIRDLPESERTVTRLFYLEGRTQTQIGELLDVPAKTVKSRLYTARKRLRKRMITMDQDDFADRVIDQIKIVEQDGRFFPSRDIRDRAHIASMAEYQRRYKASLEDPESFWADIAQDFHWFQPWDRICDYNFDPNQGPVTIRWFEGAKTSIAYNCLDRHIEARGDRPAILWEGIEGEARTLTYNDLLRQVCKCANALKSLGVQKGDRVVLYMPMIPEFPIAMIACARIGAVHCAVHNGFSAQILAERLDATESQIVITAAGIHQDDDTVSLKATVDEAIQISGSPVKTCLVVDRPGIACPMQTGRDIWWHETVAEQSADCPCVQMDAEAPLFILHTAAPSGPPKSIVHTTGGYMVYTAFTHKHVFDYHDGDIHFCVADIGWITGHSYTVYGPLANGATVLITEHLPRQTASERYWELIDKYRITQLYTSPSHIRHLITADPPDTYDLSSLRLLGSVGEPISPEVWRWYHTHVGRERCPIVDTCWQTETGGIMITALPGATPTKPGAVSLPLFGVQPVVLDPHSGQVLEGNNVEGLLAFAGSWPGQLRTLYKDHAQFEETYFKSYPGYYNTHDGCRRDEAGYYWITGRIT